MACSRQKLIPSVHLAVNIFYNNNDNSNKIIKQSSLTINFKKKLVRNRQYIWPGTLQYRHELQSKLFMIIYQSYKERIVQNEGML